MRSAAGRRPLLASLFLFVPLVVLAWFGSAELGRQEVLAARALRSQAEVAIGATARHLREAADDLLATSRPLLGDPAPRHLLDVALDLRELDPRLLHPVVLDSEARLLFPRGAGDDLEDVPFLGDPDTRAMAIAERLESCGDLAGARAVLERALQDDDERSRRRGRGRSRLRTQMMLAGLCRRLDDDPAARSHYEAAATAAALDFGRGRERTERRTIGLLCSVALAELEADADALAVLLGDIAHGVHDDVPRGVVDAVERRIASRLAGIDSDDDGRLDHAELLARTAELGTLRRVGHEFTDSYEGFLREAVRRRFRDLDDGVARIDVVDPGPGDRTLLILERLVAGAAPQVATQYPEADWLGFRVDLDALFQGAADALPLDAQTFQVELFDPSRESFEDADTRMVATGAGPFGTLLVAHPVDRAAALADRRRRGTRRVLLALALVAAAGGGAMLLLRSVSRERELLHTRVGLVSRVSHELRTPLSLIRMYAETLGRGRASDPSQRAQFAEVIVREADGLTRMVERILDFSAKEAGNLRYAPQRIDVSARVEETLSAYRPHVENRGARLETDVVAGLIADVDGNGLDNALVNLIENAVKYTPEDAADRSVEVRLRARGGDRLTLEVADRGIGIPDTERELVFRGFHRASNAGEIRGAGLGLSLVQHFCAAHGGRASAVPRAGGGTVIRLELPCKPQPHRDATQQPS